MSGSLRRKKRKLIALVLLEKFVSNGTIIYSSLGLSVMPSGRKCPPPLISNKNPLQTISFQLIMALLVSTENQDFCVRLISD